MSRMPHVVSHEGSLASATDAESDAGVAAGVEAAMAKLAAAAGVSKPPGPPSSRIKRPDPRKSRRRAVRNARKANR